VALIRGTPNERVVWPWPVRSSARTTSPGPKRRVGAIADPDFHLPTRIKNVLSPGRGVPIAPIVRRETAEHEVGTRLKRNVVALLGRQRKIFKMGLAVVAPYISVRSCACSFPQRDHRARKGVLASSPTTKIWHPCSTRFHRNVCRKHEADCRPALPENILIHIRQQCVYTGPPEGQEFPCPVLNSVPTQ